MENKEPAKIKLIKNKDGSLTKIVVKRVKKKIVLKKKTDDTSLKSTLSPSIQGGNKVNNPSGINDNRKENSSVGIGNRSNFQNKKPLSGNKKIFVKKSTNTTSSLNKNKPSNDIANFLEEVKSGSNNRDKKQESTEPARDVISEKENFNKFNHQKLKKRDDGDISKIPSEIQMPEAISVKNLAAKLNLKASQVIKKFLSLGIIDVMVNDTIDSESASIVCAEFNCEVKVVSLLEQTKVEVDKGNKEDYIERPPVVAIMGHVDHGKTTLLDALKSSSIAKDESGGITQHIDAYQVEIPKGLLSFIDTPGHVAFSAMRSRGAKITDLIILVVSAVDGIQPQTIEAIEHIKREKVPMLVAINKCDLQNADIERVKSDLAKYDIVSQDWGGDTIFVNVSALKKEGLEELIDAILLLAEIHEIKGNHKVRAHGYVVEAKIEQGRGNVVSIIVKNGVLKQGDVYLCGCASGKVRAMFDSNGNSVKEANPSTPVEIIGISELPISGELFQVLKSEKEAKKIVEKRLELIKESEANKVKKVNMDNFMNSIEQGNVEELRVVIKADVYGTIEALREVLLSQKTKEVRVSVVHSSAGNVTENDVILADAANAAIIGFRIKISGKIRKFAEKKKVEILEYDVIYNVIEEIQTRLKSMLKKERVETYLGSATVKEIFKLSSVGKIAGTFVEDGKLVRNSWVKIVRAGESIFEGYIEMIKHYKDDVKEIKSGSECGIKIKDFEEIKSGDILKAYEIKEVERELKIIEER